MLASTPAAPYYAVIFTSMLSDRDGEYETTSQRMMELAAQQDGFLGVESARNELGITVSYWENLESIALWRQNIEHTAARERGRREWYRCYKVRIAKVEREYEFEQ